MEELCPDFDSSPYDVHAIGFYFSPDIDLVNFYVGKDLGNLNTRDKNFIKPKMSWRQSRDDLQDGLRIICEFCQDPKLKHLRIYFYYWQHDHPTLELWRELMRGIQASTSIELLELYISFDSMSWGDDLWMHWMQPMVDMLSANSKLLGLNMEVTFPADISLLFSGLLAHKSLKLLQVRGSVTLMSFNKAWGFLMMALTPDSTGTQMNMALRDLRLDIDTFIGASEYRNNLDLIVTQMVTMFKANKTLTSVLIPTFVQKDRHYVQFLQALQQNRCITRLIFSNHIETQLPVDVLSELLSLVKNNYWLTTIDGYDDTSLIFEQVKAQLVINRSINDYGRPSSCRVFLCGFAEAGKTTLRKTMTTIFKEEATRFHPKHSLDKRISIPYKRVSERTKGVQVVSTRVGTVNLSIWDMGGQDEFHAFHDLVIPNLSDTGSANLFVLVCAVARGKDEAKSTKEIDGELRYWLRFLSSNIRVSEYLRPHVIIVFTFVDCLPKSMDIESHVEDLLKDVKDTFAESCHFSSTEYFLTSDSTKQVIPLTKCLARAVENDLAKVPDVYQACVQMEKVVLKWRKYRPYETLITWNKFMTLFQFRSIEAYESSDEYPQHVHDICKVVASELNKGGHIIYFDGLDVVVMDPNWFGTRIIGPIFSISPKCIDAFTKEPITNVKGYTDRERLKSVLENSFNVGKKSAKTSSKGGLHGVALEDVIRVMTQMSICYEERACEGEEKKKSVFIPATLRDEGGLVHQGKRKLNWGMIAPSSNQEMCYMGRRLQCEDPIRTYLSSGFFPRLQVVFEGKFGSSPTFHLEKNLVAFTENGMQVLVEQSGDLISEKHVGGFIDVMVQSTKDAIQTLQFVRDMVLDPIRTLCGKPAFGCQGVSLIESILRPVCVEELWLCTHRQEQAITEKKLIEEVFTKQVFEGYVHHWPLNPIQPNDHRGDKTQALLGERAWSEKVVNQRIANMVELTNELMHDEDVSFSQMQRKSQVPKSLNL